VDTPRNIFNNKNLPYPSKDRSWWQKPRHTLLGRALEKFQTGQSARGCAHLRRLTPTKHTAGPLAGMVERIPVRKTIIKIALFLICIQVFGTAQIPDILIYKRDTLRLFDCPLDYLNDTSFVNPRNLFGGNGCFYTACYRNYVATWEIIDDKLYLTSIRNACYGTSQDYVAVSLKSGSDTIIGSEYADLKKLFPDTYKDGKVFAYWVNSKMISPHGKMLYYIHDGFMSIFEKELEFTIEEGLLTNVQRFDNSKTKTSKYSENLDLASEYIRKNIDYSNLPKTEEIVIVFVSVNRADDSGKIDDAYIIRGFNEEYDNEALRVVKSIPEWVVLYRHGERIPGPRYSFKVTFDRKKK